MANRKYEIKFYGRENFLSAISGKYYSFTYDSRWSFIFRWELSL